MSSFKNFVFKNTEIESKNKVIPANPLRKKLKVNVSKSSTTNLVKTKVDPSSAAEKDAKNYPNIRFLKIILSLFIILF